MIGAWGFVIKTYKKAYINRSIGYKIMDISVFIFCMMIVFITSSKILLGISNLNTINHMDDTEVKKSLEYHNALKLSDPEAYNSEMSNYYKTKITSNLNLGFVMFNIIIAYLLFRIGYKVQPWEA
jgi:hypothetical protein